jgi:hypothetical protein
MKQHADWERLIEHMGLQTFEAFLKFSTALRVADEVITEDQLKETKAAAAHLEKTLESALKLLKGRKKRHPKAKSLTK